jgi:hypothetical protein
VLEDLVDGFQDPSHFLERAQGGSGSFRIPLSDPTRTLLFQRIEALDHGCSQTLEALYIAHGESPNASLRPIDTVGAEVNTSIQDFRSDRPGPALKQP